MPDKDKKIISSKEVLVNGYATYSEYVASGRALVSALDGLKNVQRRILFAAYNICRNKMVKSQTLSGEVMGKYNPHGDCYNPTIVNMVCNGYLYGNGSFENNQGVESIPAAAGRYTEVSMSKISETLFINPMLLHFADWHISELNYDEPINLPCLLPAVFCGISNECDFDSGMGPHIKSYYPKYDVESLLEYVIHYLKTGTFDPNLLYYKFHTLCFNTETMSDTEHKFTVEFQSTYREDEEGIHLTSVLPDTKMETILSDIPYRDLTSKYGTDILIPKKSFDPNHFKSNAHFNSLAFSKSTSDRVMVHPYSIRTAILIILNNLRNIYLPRYFIHVIEKCNALLSDYEQLIIIREKIRKNGKLSLEDLTKEEKTLTDKYSVSKMINAEKLIDEVRTERDAYQKRFDDLDTEILNMYTSAKEVVSKELLIIRELEENDGSDQKKKKRSFRRGK